MDVWLSSTLEIPDLSIFRQLADNSQQALFFWTSTG
jgi:hypothetical protein